MGKSINVKITQDGDIQSLINNIVKRIKDAEKKTEIEASKLIKDDIKHVIDEEIISYYGSYFPKSYERTESLLDVYDIIINPKSIELYFSSDRLGEHSVSNDYIYDYMFKLGYHGGAIDGPNPPGHPNPGTPYWKKGMNFKEWGDPAPKSESPFYSIKNRLEGRSKIFGQIVKDTFFKYLNK